MKILVVVDMQKDFVDGALGSKEAAAIVPNVAKKINDFDGSIAVTLDTHGDNYLETQEGKNLPVAHCIKGTDGWRLTDPVFRALDKRASSEVFMKSTFGSVDLCLWLLDMDEQFGVEEVTLVGLCTDICVISNAMLVKAFLPEAKVIIDAACCAGVTPISHETALLAMESCQISIENWED